MKVFHGIHNIGGMAGRLATAQRELGHDAFSYCYPNPHFGYLCDRQILGNGIKAIQTELAAFFEAEGRHFDVFQFYFGESFTGGRLEDVPLLKKAGKTIVFFFCGCEIRDPEVALGRYPLSGCLECNARSCGANRTLARSTAMELADKIFVSTPDLLEFVPGSEWLAQPIDVSLLDILRSSEHRRATEKTIVGHAPTQRGIKGSRHVIRAIEELQNAGYPIELKLFENVSHEEMLGQSVGVDLVVDQVLIGSYGQYAAEMMGLGKPVLCYLRPDLAQKYFDKVPIVPTAPETLAQDLARLIDDPQRRVELGERGIEYVKRTHDSTIIAQRTLETYQAILRNARRRFPKPKPSLPPRVALICSDAYPLGSRLMQIARILRDAEYRVTILADLAYEHPAQDWADFGIELIRYRAPTEVAHQESRPITASETPPFEIRILSRLSPWVREKLIRFFHSRNGSPRSWVLIARQLRLLPPRALREATRIWMSFFGPVEVPAANPELSRAIAALSPDYIHVFGISRLPESLRAARTAGSFAVFFDASELPKSAKPYLSCSSHYRRRVERALIVQTTECFASSPRLCRWLIRTNGVPCTWISERPSELQKRSLLSTYRKQPRPTSLRPTPTRSPFPRGIPGWKVLQNSRPTTASTNGETK